MDFIINTLIDVQNYVCIKSERNYFLWKFQIGYKTILVTSKQTLNEGQQSNLRCTKC